MTFFLVLVLGTTLSAQMGGETGIPSMPLMGEVDGNLYIVGPGDMMWFSFPGSLPGDTAGGSGPRTLEVTPDGYAVLPSVGAWKVSGLTLNEAASVIERGFSSRFPGMSGLAGLARMRVFLVPVTGHVNYPGVVQVTGADGLLSILDKAGGLASTGSMTGILIIGPDGDTSVVNVTDFLLLGEMSCNPSLSLGDRVHVPEAEDFVWMEGALHFTQPLSVGFSGAAEEMVWSGSRRGMTEYVPGETASGLISRMGGTAPWALRDSCYIVRVTDSGNNVRIPSPLDTGGSETVLLPGDLVVCPGTPPVVTVSGEVYSPGIYPHTAGMGVLFYVDQAGGFLRAARRSGTRVRLPDGEEVDGDDISSVPAGSSVMVPRKPFVGWEDPLLIITSVASVIIAWKSLD
ncbi:MAG: SLBB domain-containing protein [Candidatus Fermentibacteraceae bacterium]|nr:SLBB domain-containing protein [Candidatus Fermentibacteraceae bacterium]